MRHLASTALAFTFLLQTQSPSQSIRWIKPGGRISNMAVGGDYLVTTAHGTIHLWNAHDRAFMRSLPSVNRSFHGISADGTTLILQDYYSIHALDLPGGDLFSLPKAPDLEAVAYQARSNRLGIVHSDGAIRLFDIPSRQDLPHLLPALPGASALEFSPSGQHVAILLENSARLYSFATGEFVEISFAGQLHHLTFSPDGDWFAAANQWTSDPQNFIVSHDVKLWNANSGQLHKTFGAHSTAIQSVVFAPDSQQLASRDDDGHLYIWKINSDQPVDHISFPESVRTQWGGALFFLSNTELASGRIVYNLNTQAQTSFVHHKHAIHGLAFSPDGALLAVDERDEPAVWRVASGEKIFSLTNQSTALLRQSALPSTIERMEDPPILFSSASNALFFRDRVYDLTTGELIRQLPHRPAALTDEWYFTSDTRRPDVAELRGYHDDAILRTFTSNTSRGSSAIAQSPSGKLIATTGGHFHQTWFIDPSIKLWNTADASLLAEIPADLYHPFRLRFSPDESLLASGSELHYGNLAVFDLKTRTRILHLRDATSPAIGFDFLPDSRTLVYGNNTGLHFWDVPGNRRITTLTNELFNISAVAASPDGSQIAVGRLDGTILLLDSPILHHLSIEPATNGLTLSFHAHSSTAYEIQTSADLRSWSPVTNFLGPGNDFELQITPASAAFFRIVSDAPSDASE